MSGPGRDGADEQQIQTEAADAETTGALNALTTLLPPVKQVVEGALMAAGGPLTLDQILALYADDQRPLRDEIRAAVGALAADYQGRGVELVEVAGGWRIQVCREVAPWVGRLWEEKPARYSRALLETLALIAYRQPITRGEIEEIRGVTVSTQIVKTLSEREWIRIVGHRDVPGRPALYATTRRFLDYFGLRSLNDLPPLAEIRDPAYFAEALDLAGAGAGRPEAADAGTPDGAAGAPEPAAVVVMPAPRDGVRPADVPDPDRGATGAEQESDPDDRTA